MRQRLSCDFAVKYCEKKYDMSNSSCNLREELMGKGNQPYDQALSFIIGEPVNQDEFPEKAKTQKNLRKFTE